MKKIYLIRHGQTEWNVQQRMQGHSDSPLTKLGQEQGKALGKILQETPIDICYASPAGRAFKTAENIIQKRCPIEKDDRLREIFLASWEGRLFSDVSQEYPIAGPAFWDDPANYQHPDDGENFLQVQERAINFLNEITTTPFKNIAIVTHTVVIKSILAELQNFPLDKLWDGPKIMPTSLTTINYDSTFQLEKISETTHYQLLDEALLASIKNSF